MKIIVLAVVFWIGQINGTGNNGFLVDNSNVILNTGDPGNYLLAQ